MFCESFSVLGYAGGNADENNACEVLRKARNYDYNTDIEKTFTAKEAFKFLDVTGNGKITGKDAAMIFLRSKNPDFEIPTEATTQPTTEELSDIEKNLPSIPTNFTETKSVSDLNSLLSAISYFEGKTGDFAVFHRPRANSRMCVCDRADVQYVFISAIQCKA